MLAAAASSSGTSTLVLFIFSAAAMLFVVIAASRLFGLIGLVVSLMICIVVSLILMVRYGGS